MHTIRFIRSRIWLMVVVTLLLIDAALATPAYAAGTSQAMVNHHQQTALILAAAIGFVAAHAGSILVKYSAPQWLKAVVTLALSVLAGVIPTVAWAPNASLATYVGAILAAFVTQMAAHASGLTNVTAALTSNFGLTSTVADPLETIAAVGHKHHPAAKPKAKAGDGSTDTT